MQEVSKAHHPPFWVTRSAGLEEVAKHGRDKLGMSFRPSLSVRGSAACFGPPELALLPSEGKAGWP